MALPSSGTISTNDIRTELGIPSQAPFSLDAARLGSYVPLNPYSPALPPSTGTVSLSSWYSYCHTCTTIYSFTIYRAGIHAGLKHWLSAAAACTGTRDYPLTVYSSSSTLGVGSSLYYLSSGQYIPLIINDAGGGEEIWLWDGSGSKPVRMTDAGSNIISTVGTCITCTEYYNFQSYDIFVYYNNCSGVATSGYIGAGQSWCAQDGTVSGDPGWGAIGSC